MMTYCSRKSEAEMKWMALMEQQKCSHYPVDPVDKTAALLSVSAQYNMF